MRLGLRVAISSANFLNKINAEESRSIESIFLEAISNLIEISFKTVSLKVYGLLYFLRYSKDNLNLEGFQSVAQKGERRFGGEELIIGKRNFS